MPASASAISPRRATPAKCRSRAPRRCRASTRCAPISALGLVQGIFVPQPRPARAWLAELGTTIDDAEHAHRRQCDERLGDVGGQCRDGQPGARHRRRQVPPDRRQSEDHAAPQPRMAGDAGPAAAGLRQRRLRGARPGAAGLRRRGRGQSHAAGARRTASRASRCSSMASSGGPFPARQHVEASKAIARLHRLDPDAHHLRRAERGSDRRRRVPQRRGRGRQRAGAVRA